MKSCPSCSVLNPDAAVFCQSCGAPIPASAPPPPPQGYPPAGYPPPQAGYPPQQGGYPPPQGGYPPPPQSYPTPPPQGGYPPQQGGYPPPQGGYPPPPQGYPPQGGYPYPPPQAGYPYPPTPPRAQAEPRSFLPAIGAIILLIACFLPFFDFNRLATVGFDTYSFGLGGITGYDSLTASVFQIVIGVIQSSGPLLQGIGYIPFIAYLPFIYMLTLISLPIYAIIGLTAFAQNERANARARKAGRDAFWAIIAWWGGLILLVLILGGLGGGSVDAGEIFRVFFQMMGIGVLVALIGAVLQWQLK